MAKYTGGESGFTTVELMTAMAVTFILCGFLYSVYFFSLRISRRWQDRVKLVDATALCMHRLTGDLIRCASVDCMHDTTWIITPERGDCMAYAWRDSALFRNGAYVNPPGSHVVWMRLGEASSKGEHFGGPDHRFADMFESNDDDGTLLWRIELCIGAGDRQMKAASLVSPRNAGTALIESLGIETQKNTE